MLQDLRYALRQLVKAPGFAAVAILTLALGIGANTAIFSVVEALLLSPLPYPESGRIAQIGHSPQAFASANAGADGGTFLDWKQHATAFEAIAAIHQTDLNLSGIAEPAQLSGYAVSADYLRVFRINPSLGRGFVPADDAPGSDNDVVILTHEMWQHRLSGDPAILGKSVRLDGRSFTVIGVLPPGILNAPNIEFLVPAAIEAAGWKQLRNYNYVCNVVARLKPGATFAQAQAELVAANNALRSLYPPNKADWTVTVDSLQSASSSGARSYLAMLMGTVGLVLLIACANVANLLLARAATRQTEIAVRIALGASAGRIVRLLLVESVVLALLGGIAGLFVASFAIGPLVAFCAAGIVPGLTIGLNPAVLLFTLLVSLATGILFGLVPALRIARPDVAHDLKDSSRGAVGGARHRLQRTFIVAETGLTVVLLFASGLLLRSFMATLSADTGFNRENILLFDINRDSNFSPTPAHRVRFIQSALRELAARPGIAAAGMISAAPFNDQRFYGDTIRRSESPDPSADINTGFDGIGGDIFQVLGTPLLRGRFLADSDSIEVAAKAVIINQALARQLFGAEDPLGRHVRFKDLDWEVVGVVGNTSRFQLDAPPPPMVYLPTRDFPWSVTLAIRTRGSPLATVDAVRSAIRAVDPDQPIANLRTMRQAIDNSIALRLRRMMLTLVGAFAGIALLLACVGLYGVMAYSVTQRTREIGVRIALGAASGQILRDIIRGGLVLVGIGIGIGALASVPAGFGLQSQVYGMHTADFALVFGIVALSLGAVAALACWLPARRATRVDPMVALRAE
jgi:putative ABC transport system permease protein